MLAAIVCGYEAAGRISEAITPGFRAARLSRLPRRDLRRRGRGGAAAAARCGADGAGDRAVGDLDRRPGDRGRYLRRARIPRGPRGDARHQRGAGGTARLSSARRASWKRGTASSRRSAASMARRRGHRDARAGRELGHLHRHGDQAGARRPSVSRARRGRGQRGARRRTSRRRMWRASPSRVRA